MHRRHNTTLFTQATGQMKQIRPIASNCNPVQLDDLRDEALPTQLDDLPDEVLLQILDYTQTIADFFSLASTCKRLAYISKDKSLTYKFYKAALKMETDTIVETYKQCIKLLTEAMQLKPKILTSTTTQSFFYDAQLTTPQSYLIIAIGYPVLFMANQLDNTASTIKNGKRRTDIIQELQDRCDDFIKLLNTYAESQQLSLDSATKELRLSTKYMREFYDMYCRGAAQVYESLKP